MLGVLRKENTAPPMPTSPSACTIPENKLLNPEERELVKWLLANGAPEAGAYARQLGNLRVVGRCSCGCPTVDLANGDSEEIATGPSQILADFIGVTADNVEVGVVLHARQNEISELEVYSLGITDTTGRTFGLPKIESLKAMLNRPQVSE
jgi:hypothetical protein